MKPLNSIFIALVFVFLSMHFASAIIVDADYITLYSGEEGTINLNVDNNENFDIKDISVSLNLEDLPFSAVGSSEENIDKLREDKDDDVSFKIKASTDIKPGDYNIPYTIKYEDVGGEGYKKDGSFGLRVSSKTELDFALEVKGKEISSAVVGQEGRINLEIINKGLGEIKAVQVEVFPNGFDLLSKEKIFIGTVNADDTDLASFDVIFNVDGIFKAKIIYKDFDNNEKTINVEIPFYVYTEKEAFEKGIIKKSNSLMYLIGAVVLIVVWIVWRRRKNRKKDGKV